MNNSHGRTVNAAGKKQRTSFAALSLIGGLAWAFSSPMAMAIGEPIPGIDIVVKCLGCSPPYHGIPAPTGADGAYQFTGLAPGSYELSIGGRLVQTISLNKGTISGVLSREPDGKASITFNGRIVPVVIGPPGAPVSTTRSNKKAGIAKGGIPPKVEVPGTLAIGSEANDVLMQVSTTRGTAPGSDGGDKKPGISDQGTVGGLISYSTAPPPKDGAGKLPGITGNPIQGTEVGLEGDPGRKYPGAKIENTRGRK